MMKFTATIMALSLIAGCQSSGGGERPPLRTITLDAFEQSPPDGGPQPDRDTAPIAHVRADDPTDDSADALPDTIEIEPATVPLGASGPDPIDPDLLERAMSGERVSIEDPVIIESLIGQVNGRPIFADEFFAPIEDELRANARTMNDDRAFAQFAFRRISSHLNQVVLNELFLAEAEGKLTVEQQQGLLAFMRNLREQTIADVSGVRSETDERLREEEGMGLEDFLGKQRDQELIRSVLIEKVRPRVIVSWRDIERAYRLNFERYNPPAKITLRRITYREPDNESRVLEIQDLIDRGTTPDELAELATDVRVRADAQTMEMPDGTVDSLELNDDLREALRGVTTGGVSRPVRVGSSLWWHAVEKIERPQGKTIYDPEVQAELRNEIFAEQFNRERIRYIETLFDEAIQARIDDMANRLLVIAFQRYGRPSDEAGR